MYPLLLKIGPVPIHTYGFMIAVGFLVAIAVVRRLAARSKLDVEKVLDLAFWSLLVGFIGARLLFILTRLDTFLADPMSVFKVWEGGLVFYGGPILVVPFLVWYVRKHRLPVWNVLDVMGPGLVIGQIFGRFGCLSAGCCYGRPTESPWGIKLYSDLVDLNLRGVPLHPTQLYEAVAMIFLLLAMLWTFKRKQFDGQIALMYFIGYPIIRSIVEVYRGDLIRGFIIEDILSTSQFISILIFVPALFILIWRIKQVNVGKAAESYGR